MTKAAILRQQLREYLRGFSDATSEEIAAVREWVKEGNSPYENGDGVYDDNCHPMDFINTMRFWDGMYQEWLEDPEGFMAEHCPDRTSFEELDPESWMNHSTDA